MTGFEKQTFGSGIDHSTDDLLTYFTAKLLSHYRLLFS